MSSDPAVIVRGLGKCYALHARPSDRLKRALLRRGAPPELLWALRDVSFEVARGEALGIMGRNGCGKSTLLEMIAGTLTPTTGQVHVRGQLAALLELGAGFDPELTGRENVFVYGTLLGMSKDELDARFDEILAFSQIGAYMDEPVKTYSSGMFVRLAFSVAVSATPEILVIDEALTVGDEAFQRRCFARIEELKESGVTMLFVSHAAGTVQQICDRVLLLDRGESLLLGEPAEVIARYHQLIYAAPEQQDAIRDEIRAQAGAPTPLRSHERLAPQAADHVEAIEGEGYDAELVSKSRVEYARRGARISDVCVRTPDGRRVNVLHRGELYYYEYQVEFDDDAIGVRYGIMLKTVVGSELGGIASDPPGHGIPHVRAGTRVRLRLPFRARLASGTYFANAGVVGLVDGHEIFLHRIVDVLMLRVALEKDARVTGSIDLSSDEAAQIEPE